MWAPGMDLRCCCQEELLTGLSPQLQQALSLEKEGLHTCMSPLCTAPCFFTKHRPPPVGELSQLLPHFAFLQTVEILHKGVLGGTQDCLSVVSSGHVSFYLCLQSVIEQSQFSLFVFTENKQQDIKVKDHQLQDVFLLWCSDGLMLQIRIVESSSSPPPPPCSGARLLLPHPAQVGMLRVQPGLG